MPVDRISTQILGDELEIVATMNLGQQWDRLLGEFLGEWSRLQRQGLGREEMERSLQAFTEDLSEKPMEDLARKSAGVAYNQGRGAAIKTAAKSGAVEYVVRSEVLDELTCDSCINLDGTIVEVNSDDFSRLQPPAECQGGDRCRGFYVAVV